MPARLDVTKVVYGAFMVPWWNRRAFGRALGIPLALLVTLTLSWYYGGKYLPQFSNWVLCVAWGGLFSMFAVTCHRLVLLDAASVASQPVPRWSWRETRFFYWLVGTWLICWVAGIAAITLILNLAIMVIGNSITGWFDWAPLVAGIPAYYLFARLSPIFPATAIDRRVDLKWAWRLTRGNGWRLFVVVAVLPWLLSHFVGLLYRGNATAVETAMLTFVGSALFAVEIAALSLSYRELTREEGG
jgi:hypothetical protein